jgi:hypothetical protein
MRLLRALQPFCPGLLRAFVALGPKRLSSGIRIPSAYQSVPLPDSDQRSTRGNSKAPHHVCLMWNAGVPSYLLSSYKGLPRVWSKQEIVMGRPPTIMTATKQCDGSLSCAKRYMRMSTSRSAPLSVSDETARTSPSASLAILGAVVHTVQHHVEGRIVERPKTKALL